MKDLWNKVKEDLDKKTNPDQGPLITGRMLEIFFLRLLLMILGYLIVNTFIIKLKVWQFILMDAVVYLLNGVVEYVKKKR